MIRRLDAWVGKRVMHPPIIWICQRAGINQFAFYRFGWMVVGLHALWFDRGVSTGWTAFVMLFALSRVLSAGIHPERPASPSFLLRAAFLATLAIDVIGAAVLHRFNAGDLNTLMALVAEYATTITTIPPRKTDERVGKLARLGA